jgi:hypothetical protein
MVTAVMALVAVAVMVVADARAGAAATGRRSRPGYRRDRQSERQSTCQGAGAEWLSSPRHLQPKTARGEDHRRFAAAAQLSP